LNKKQLITFGCCLIFLGHFATVLIYALPKRFVPHILQFISYHYVVPQHHYNFKIFAPEPPMHNEIFAFKELGGETPEKWVNLNGYYISQHQANRFAGYRTKLVIHKINSWAAFYSLSKAKNDDEFYQSSECIMLKKYLRFVTQKKEGKIEVVYIKWQVKTGEKEITRFPIIKLND
jgi:hypothetical protein